MATEFQYREGKLIRLRTNDLNHQWGGGNDYIITEVLVQLDAAPDRAYGFQLRAGDPNLPGRLAMLSTLRDAFNHNHKVGICYDIETGKKHGHLRRVELLQPTPSGVTAAEQIYTITDEKAKTVTGNGDLAPGSQVITDDMITKME